MNLIHILNHFSYLIDVRNFLPSMTVCQLFHLPVIQQFFVDLTNKMLWTVKITQLLEPFAVIRCLIHLILIRNIRLSTPRTGGCFQWFSSVPGGERSDLTLKLCFCYRHPRLLRSVTNLTQMSWLVDRLLASQGGFYSMKFSSWMHTSREVQL